MEEFNNKKYVHRYRYDKNNKIVDDVYYNGVKLAKIQGDKVEYYANVLLINEKQRKNIDKFKTDMKNWIDIIEKYFVFLIGTKKEKRIILKYNPNNILKHQKNLNTILDELYNFLKEDKLINKNKFPSREEFMFNKKDENSYEYPIYLSKDRYSWNEIIKFQNDLAKVTIEQKMKKSNLNIRMKPRGNIKDNINNINEVMEIFINEYCSIVGGEDEKMFQQYLMIENNPRDKLYNDSFKLEMEVGIKSPTNCENKVNTGRVDNVFLKKDKFIFVEVKYNESVIMGTNGICKHLDDIIKFVNSEKYKEIVLENLTQNIEIRNQLFNTKLPTNLDFTNLEYHIVIGYDFEKKEEIKRTLENLNNEKEIEQLIKAHKLPKETKTIDYYKKQLKGKVDLKIYLVEMKKNPETSEIEDYLTKYVEW